MCRSSGCPSPIVFFCIKFDGKRNRVVSMSRATVESIDERNCSDETMKWVDESHNAIRRFRNGLTVLLAELQLPAGSAPKVFKIQHVKDVADLQIKEVMQDGLQALSAR